MIKEKINRNKTKIVFLILAILIFYSGCIEEPAVESQIQGHEDKNISTDLGETAKITSAKQLKIDAKEIGAQWSEEQYQYIEDPVIFAEDFVDFIDQITETTQNPEGAEEDKERFLEMATELRKADVKDGSILQLKKKVTEIAVNYIELDTFVFNDVDGAKAYFDYRYQKSDGTKISGIGDEAAVVSDEHSSHIIYLIRISNTYLEVMFLNGEEGTREITEKIVETIQA